MGLLDDIKDKIGGKPGQSGDSGQAGDGGLQSLTKLLSANGGVQGIMAKLTSSGLGQQVQSWVGTGENKPVSGDQVSKALDTDSLNKMAQETGSTPQKVSDEVAQALPEVVDKATPGGQVPQQGDDPLHKGMDAIKGMFAHK